jgi:hypothetical protein
MSMNEKDLLGGVSISSKVVDEAIVPFDAQTTLNVLRYNKDYSSVPCYCRHCGITAYIPIEEANTLFELYGNGEKFPPYEVGIYIENDGCPRCLLKRGETPVVKRFEVK